MVGGETTPPRTEGKDPAATPTPKQRLFCWPLFRFLASLFAGLGGVLSSASLVIVSTGPVVQYRQHYWETAETSSFLNFFSIVFATRSLGRSGKHERGGVEGEGEGEEGTRDPTDRR